MKQIEIINKLFNFKTKKESYLFSLFFCLITHLLGAQNDFISALKFNTNIPLNTISNNPYKLFTEYQFGKTNTTAFIGHLNKENYFIDLLEADTIKRISINKDSLYAALNATELVALKYYGFSKYELCRNQLISECDNVFYFFKCINNAYTLKQKYKISDTLNFTDFKIVNDSLLYLIFYPSGYNSNNNYKLYLFNTNTKKITQTITGKLDCAAVNYFEGGYNRFDIRNELLVISNNINYEIELIDLKGRVTQFKRSLNIDTAKLIQLNAIKKSKGSYDSLKKVFKQLPKILNVQFLNDSSLIVNYTTKPDTDTLGTTLKDSKVDVLKLRKGSIVFEKTFSDQFVYANKNQSEKITQAKVNPYLPGSGSFLFVNDKLFILQIDNMIPSSRYTNLKSYLNKARRQIFNLKGKAIFSYYDFKTH